MAAAGEAAGMAAAGEAAAAAVGGAALAAAGTAGCAGAAEEAAAPLWWACSYTEVGVTSPLMTGAGMGVSAGWEEAQPMVGRAGCAVVCVHCPGGLESFSNIINGHRRGWGVAELKLSLPVPHHRDHVPDCQYMCQQV